MARPTKSAALSSGKVSKDEKKRRKEAEQKLKGEADNISPPAHLSTKQKKIFNYIVSELKASGILGNLDSFMLSSASIAIDRLQQIETEINEDFTKILDKNLMAAKEKYSKDFFRCCNELSLSPQSRAKLGNINLQNQQQKEDPLLQVLAGGRK